MRSRKKHPFSKARKLSKFKVTNWSEYNNFLRNRGRIDFMIAENLIDNWYEESPNNRKRGRQKCYSDHVILQCLKIRYLFGLKLRQTQGFINWIFAMVKLPVTCPDYTTLCKRGKKLKLELDNSYGKEFNYICIDSTGIQTYTGNEWLENKHGKRYNRRTWKKLHISVSEEGEILANITTKHDVDDRSEVEFLISNIKANEVLADRGYYGESIYQMIKEQGKKAIIRPPNVSEERAGITDSQLAVKYVQKKGYHAWRVKSDYGRRELVENAFFRFKTSFGNRFLSRDEDNMKNEMTIKCQFLNKMLEIGKVISMPVC